MNNNLLNVEININGQDNFESHYWDIMHELHEILQCNPFMPHEKQSENNLKRMEKVSDEISKLRKYSTNFIQKKKQQYAKKCFWRILDVWNGEDNVEKREIIKDLNKRFNRIINKEFYLLQLIDLI